MQDRSKDCGKAASNISLATKNLTGLSPGFRKWPATSLPSVELHCSAVLVEQHPMRPGKGAIHAGQATMTVRVKSGGGERAGRTEGGEKRQHRLSSRRTPSGSPTKPGRI